MHRDTFMGRASARRVAIALGSTSTVLR